MTFQNKIVNFYQQMSYIDELTQKLLPLTDQVTNHSLYRQMTSIHRLHLFMEQHVFAVWDFMCLLKELHRRIVSVSAPWYPPKDALSANLINSILVEEEGDITEDGMHYASHFEIYLAAILVQSGKMRYIGLCNIPAWYLGRAQTIAELRG